MTMPDIVNGNVNGHGVNGNAVNGHHDNQLDILVVGAGLGGLASAIACLLAGHRVTCLEAAQQLGEVSDTSLASFLALWYIYADHP